MKHVAKVSLLAATLVCAFNQASAFVVVDDNSELFVTAAAAVQLDDNIYLDSTNEQDDTIYSITPGLDYVFGQNAATSGNFFFREEFRRYSDNDNQDVELANLGANIAFENGVTKVSLNGSYTELSQNDNKVNPVGEIARRDLTILGGTAEFGVATKTKLGVGLNHTRTDYKPTGFSDSAITSLPLDAYFEASPKLDWSLGYRYRQSDLSGAGVDTDDNFFNFGARGEFTPKMTGQVRVGYTQRSFDTGSDEDLFGVDARLGYAFSDKTVWSITLANDFGSSGLGASTKNFNLGLNASSNLTEQWFVSAALNFSTIDYPTSSDDYTEAQVAVAYQYNKWMSFSGSLVVRDNSSDLPVSEFANTVFSFGANFRY